MRWIFPILRIMDTRLSSYSFHRSQVLSGGNRDEAADLHEFKKPLVFREVPRPQLEPGDALMKVEACGARHSDLPVAAASRARARKFAAQAGNWVLTLVANM